MGSRVVVTRHGFALASALLLAGCSGGTRSEFDVGVHHVSAAIHAGWESVDQGKRRVLRRGEERLVLEDLGPVGREGIGREVERARQLWRHGRSGEAATVLTMVPVPDEHFATLEQRHGFWEAWGDVSQALERRDPGDLEPRFERLKGAIAGLRERSAEATVEAALARLGEDGRRAIAARALRTVNGREWITVDTWNRLSHEDRRRFAILLDGGYLLVLHAEGGRPASGGEFEPVLRSLRILRSPAQSAEGERLSST